MAEREGSGSGVVGTSDIISPMINLESMGSGTSGRMNELQNRPMGSMEKPDMSGITMNPTGVFKQNPSGATQAP